MSDVQFNVDKPFNYRGRFGRLSYLAWTFLLSLACLVVVVVIGLIYTILGSLLIAGVLAVPAGVAMIYFGLILMIRRLHDLNLTGWLCVIAFIPLIGSLFSLFIFVWKGTTGENRFGAQRETLGWEKTLGWIYAVIFPLAIIALAIPEYQKYIERAKIAQQLDPNMEPEERRAAIQDKMNSADSSVLDQMQNDPELEKSIQDAEEADAQGTENPDEVEDVTTDAPEDAVPPAPVTNK